MTTGNKNTIAASLTALLLLCHSAAFAQDMNAQDVNNNTGNLVNETPAASPIAPMTNDASPASTIPMLSGGVGDEELDRIHSVQNQFNTKLLFTDVQGAFVAFVPVSIEDGKGNLVVKTVTKGPIFLLNLPAGHYKVTAQVGGETRELKIKTQAKGLHTFQMRFSQQAADTVGEERSEGPRSE